MWKARLGAKVHRDSGRIALESEPEDNDGNFRALLRFRAKTYDVLKTCLTESGRNAQYTSPHIQNEIIESCNDIILQRLAIKINASSHFSILLDETTDIAGIEQLSVCARYIEPDTCTVQEAFLQFYHCMKSLERELPWS
mgnify:CR=1 FL=1